MASGGKAAKVHGTDGDSYELLKMMGHKITPIAPALVSLNCEDFTKALNIIENAKTSRPSVCNAAEVLIVNSKIANEFLPRLKEKIV